MSENTWNRPADILDARNAMLAAEANRDYETAALAAITLSDLTSGRNAADAESFERQAAVYASLHQAQTALFIAENRQPINPVAY
ncbi:hypothetical protein ACRCUN_06100 [Mycobacterium sp. LTG2003]